MVDESVEEEVKKRKEVQDQISERREELIREGPGIEEVVGYKDDIRPGAVEEPVSEAPEGPVIREIERDEQVVEKQDQAPQRGAPQQEEEPEGFKYTPSQKHDEDEEPLGFQESERSPFQKQDYGGEGGKFEDYAQEMFNPQQRQQRPEDMRDRADMMGSPLSEMSSKDLSREHQERGRVARVAHQMGRDELDSIRTSWQVTDWMFTKRRAMMPPSELSGLSNIEYKPREVKREYKQKKEEKSKEEKKDEE